MTDDRTVCAREYWQWEDYDVEAHERRLRAGFSVERYERDDAGRVVRADKQYLLPEGDTAPWPEFWPAAQALRAVYDDAGRLETVYQDTTWARRGDVADDLVPRTVTSPVWRAPVNRTQLKQWSTAVEGHLARAVMERSIAVTVGEIAAVALLYDDQQVLPPIVGVLLASERDRFVADFGDEAAAYIWNPAEWSILDDAPAALVGSNPDIAQAVSELNFEDRASLSHQRSRRLLNRVAKRLNETTWPAATTDDFIVFATDTEQAELLANLRASVPAPLPERHRRRPGRCKCPPHASIAMHCGLFCKAAARQTLLRACRCSAWRQTDDSHVRDLDRRTAPHSVHATPKTVRKSIARGLSVADVHQPSTDKKSRSNRLRELLRSERPSAEQDGTGRDEHDQRGDLRKRPVVHESRRFRCETTGGDDAAGCNERGAEAGDRPQPTRTSCRKGGGSDGDEDVRRASTTRRAERCSRRPEHSMGAAVSARTTHMTHARPPTTPLSPPIRA